MHRSCLALSLVLMSSSAEAEPAVCGRLDAAAARENAPAPTGPRKVWLMWSASQPGDPAGVAAPSAAAVAGKVVRVVGERTGGLLVVATAAQLARLPAGMMHLDADELDFVACGSLGYHAPPLGRVAPALDVPAAWRIRGAGPATYCVQLVREANDTSFAEAIGNALGLSDGAPLACGGEAPASCLLTLTPREAARVARLPFVRGVFPREPALKLGASLACPGRGDLPVAASEVAALLRAAVAPATEIVTVVVRLEGEPEERARFAARLPKGATIVAGDDVMAIVSLPRGGLVALAAIPEVFSISEQGPPPTIDRAVE